MIYGHPTDAEAFEEYYAKTHMPQAGKMQGYEKRELTKFISAPDGSKAEHYRMAEFWFNSPEAMQETMSSPEGRQLPLTLQTSLPGAYQL